MRLRIGVNARAVVQMPPRRIETEIAQNLDRFFISRDLALGMGGRGAVRRRQMGHQAVELDAVEPSERARKLREFIEPNSEPAHPRVDFEMEIDIPPQRAGARIQLFNLIEAVD